MSKAARVALGAFVFLVEGCLAWLFLGLWKFHLDNIALGDSVLWVVVQWVTLGAFVVVAVAGAAVVVLAPRTWALLSLAAPVIMFWIFVFELLKGGGF